MGERAPSGPQSIIVIGACGMLRTLTRTRCAPVSSAVSIAMRSPAGSKGTARVARTIAAAGARGRRGGRLDAFGGSVVTNFAAGSGVDSTMSRLTTSVADGTKPSPEQIGPIVHSARTGPDRGGGGSGNCTGRGATASQSDVVVGRVRRRAREPRLPDRGAGWLDRRARHRRRVHPVVDLDQPRSAAEQHPRRAGVDVPEQVGRRGAVRTRGVAQVPDARRSCGHVRLLDRLVGRAVDQRARGRHADPGGVVLGYDVDDERRGLRPQPADR